MRFAPAELRIERLHSQRTDKVELDEDKDWEGITYCVCVWNVEVEVLTHRAKFI